ncbi:MAG: DsrE/DsrF/DrsH-like family protein, partial [Planctomycetaceae bacterium]|nr:DsrE/DsrF/DrsH-like family protein [Planctomycetaceae bacterium]
ALVIATGAAACGMKVSMFFTFWATSALRSGTAQQPGKRLMERMFGWMLPNGIRRTKLSKMEMGGLGRWMMLREMKSHKMQDADELLGMAAELGVEIRVCEMSMRLMGIRSEELIEYPRMEFCGAASLAEQLSQANSSLFI